MLLGGVLLVACSDFLAPKPERPFTSAYEMAAPDSFAIYWRQIDSCSGLPRPMTTRFFRIDSISFGPAGLIVGHYATVADRITLGLYALAHPGTIRHEMLHAHLREVTWNAKTAAETHPAEYGTKCAGLIENWR